MEKVSETMLNHNKNVMKRKTKVGVTMPTIFFTDVLNLSPPPRTGLPGCAKISVSMSKQS
eukprot:2995098-Rhodomonas_salina.1